MVPPMKPEPEKNLMKQPTLPKTNIAPENRPKPIGK